MILGRIEVISFPEMLFPRMSCIWESTTKRKAVLEQHDEEMEVADWSRLESFNLTKGSSFCGVSGMPREKRHEAPARAGCGLTYVFGRSLPGFPRLNEDLEVDRTVARKKYST